MEASTPRPLALVTGASSGIGFELARQFAEHGYDLIIAAEDDAIDAAARELQNGTAVEAVKVDLAAPDGVERLYARVREHGDRLEAVALNAGIGMGGDFATQTDLDQELKLVDLNVRSTVHLAKRVVGDMVKRGTGKVLFTSSIASTMPGTYQAVYNASKSFVQSFALALRAELKDTGVTITSLMPGPTETEFFERAEMLDTKRRRRRKGRSGRRGAGRVRGAHGGQGARSVALAEDQGAGPGEPADARQCQGKDAREDGRAGFG
jgi:short-subunit dehydrogenase